MKAVFQLLIATMVACVGFIQLRPWLRLAGMRFFRDLGKIKSRKRLMAGSHNSLALLLGREKELETSLQDNGVIVDVEELRLADGGAEGRPLWLAIKGRVYDVGGGAKFYGPDGPYHGFVGRDATRAFCTGCLKPECLISSLANLTRKQIREADRWVEYYELHDRYKFVGMLRNVTGNIDDLVEKALQAEAEGKYSSPILLT